MTVKGQVLSVLEANRDTYCSGSLLAKTLGVSRSAVWKAIEQLRVTGYPIDASKSRGYRLLSSSDLLSAQGIAIHLTVPGLSLQVHNSLASTNTTLRQLAETGAPEGTVMLSGEQTAGRGRRGHTFFSPSGSGLYLSILLRPSISAQESLSITTCAASAVALAIEETAAIPAQIKWVNDVFCHGKKVCGILTEASLDLESGGLSYAIVGIGVNILSPAEGFPQELAEIAGAVYGTSAAPADCRSRLAAAILNRFFAWYPTLDAKPFFSDYRKRSMLLGQPISILENGASRPAMALDLTPAFQLIVREESGQIRTLSSGEVSIRPRL